MAYAGLPPQPFMYETFVEQWSPVSLPVRPCDVIQDFITYYDFKHYANFDDLMEILEEHGYKFNRETNKIHKNQVTAQN